MPLPPSLFSSAADCKLVSLPIAGRQPILFLRIACMSNAYMVQVVVVLHTLKTMSSFFYGKNEICCTSLDNGSIWGCLLKYLVSAFKYQVHETLMRMIVIQASSQHQRVHISVQFSYIITSRYRVVLFLWLRVALLKYSLVNRAIFPDFCTRPYTACALPPGGPRPAPALGCAWIQGRCMHHDVQVKDIQRMHSTQDKISSMNSMTQKILNTDSKSVIMVKIRVKKLCFFCITPMNEGRYIHNQSLQLTHPTKPCLKFKQIDGKTTPINEAYPQLKTQISTA